MKQALAFLFVATLFAVPAVQAASYERQDAVDQDGAHAENEIRGEFDVQLTLEMPVVFYLAATNEAGFAPQDSQLSPGLDAIQAFLAAFLAGLPPIQPVTVPEPAAEAVSGDVDAPAIVAQETDGVLDEGASVGTASTASNDG
ncbi:MAG TPA: hypothetical protein VI818_07470, partial [Candidatus Thermoplasmatota archaeon]|nr:hypothetical protein [Candidatus Thermoplasmatota archaeon]